MSTAKHTAVRLDDATRTRIDALIPRMSTEWHKATQSDVMRAIIISGLPLVEEKYPAAPSKPEKKGGRR